MNNKKITWVIVVLVIIIGVVIILTSSDTSVQEPTDTTSPQTGEQPAVQALPDNVDELSLSQPDIVLPAPPDEEGVADVNIYRVSVVDGAITPQQLVFEKGASAQIEIAVEGADYDVWIEGLNIYIPLSAGSTTAFDINTETADAGVYTLTCRDTCPEDAQSLSIVIK